MGGSVLDKISDDWNVLLYEVQSGLVEEGKENGLKFKVKKKEALAFINSILSLIKVEEVDLPEIIEKLQPHLFRKEHWLIFGYVDDFGTTAYAKQPRKLKKLASEINKLRRRGEKILERIYSPPKPKRVNEPVDSRSSGEQIEEMNWMLEKPIQEPTSEVCELLEQAPTNFRNLDQVIDYYKLTKPIRLSGGFYQNYSNIHLISKAKLPHPKNWGKLIERELGFIPQEELHWEAVWAAYGVLPPEEFRELSRRLSKFNSRLRLSSLDQPVKKTIDYHTFPSSGALAYDVLKAIRVSEWFDLKEFEPFGRLTFEDGGFFRLIERNMALCGRLTGYELADALQERHGIVFELLPPRK